MAEPEEIEEEAPTKRSKKPLLIGLILALALGGGSFYAVWSGLILAPAHQPESSKIAAPAPGPLPDIAFVPIPPLVVNVGSGGAAHHLRFHAQLEVVSSAERDVTLMLPRVADVLNSYLRAVDLSELEQQAVLVRLRAQLLRRIQIVTGENRVRDLLIMEFVLN